MQILVSSYKKIPSVKSCCENEVAAGHRDICSTVCSVLLRQVIRTRGTYFKMYSSEKIYFVKIPHVIFNYLLF